MKSRKKNNVLAILEQINGPYSLYKENSLISTRNLYYDLEKDFWQIVPGIEDIT